VLAGGKSSRMGRPKALLPFGDRPLIAHIVSTLAPLFREVVIVAAPGQDLPPLPAAIVRDEVPYQGPVGGICYGMRAVRSDICFVTSCDSAFLSPALISHLIARLGQCDVVVPRWQDRLQPLHAVYRRRVLPVLEEQLARGELRPVSLFDKVRTCTIDEAEIGRFDPEGWSFFNMNRPEDYARALERWRALRAGGSAEGAAPGRDPISCTVELFGVARLIARTSEVALMLPAGATCADVFAALARRFPALVGRVIAADERALTEGYACSLNGLEFVATPQRAVAPGDSILILSADAGG